MSSMAGASSPFSRRIRSISSVVTHARIERAVSPSAPAFRAQAAMSSARPSPSREWVFMMPPESLISFPMWPASSTSAKPASAAASRALPT